MSCSLAHCISICKVNWSLKYSCSSSKHQESLRTQELGAKMACKQSTLKVHFIHMKIFFQNIIIFNATYIKTTTNTDNTIKARSKYFGLFINRRQLTLNLLVSNQDQVFISFIVLMKINR